MRNLLTVAFLAISSFIMAQTLKLNEVLSKSLEYHDPNSEWPNFSGRLQFEESRPDGSIRNTTVWIDNSKGYFKINRNGTEIHGMLLDSCFIEKGDVSCERVETIRNYYTYLWGLPMKIFHDKPDSIKLNTTNNDNFIIQVTYDKDTWHFIINKEKFKIMAYKFVKNNNSNKGEFIRLEGELIVGSMKIPSIRTWFELPDETLLGTDKLISFKPFKFEN